MDYTCHPSRGADRWALLLALLLLPLACTDNPGSPPAIDPITADVAIDPISGTFLLDRLEVPVPDGEALHLELVGSHLVVDRADETVQLDVAIRNGGARATGVLGVGAFDFDPPGVVITNPDAVAVPNFGRSGAFWFDYQNALGDDGSLTPGETSAARTWIFAVPGLGPFAFQAGITLVDAPAAHIGGAAFVDRNRNGAHDPDEAGFVAGQVVLVGPDGHLERAPLREGGRFRFAVTAAGLYTLRLVPNPDVCAVAPGPIEVVLPQGPDGQPASYDGALFAVAPCADTDAVVHLTDAAPDSIRQDPYDLLDARLEGNVLALGVGFSGCSPEHPLTLWASTRFMESEPPRTWILLAHDDRGELCDAYFRRDLRVDLEPLRRALVHAYGEPVRAILELRDPSGVVLRELRYEP